MFTRALILLVCSQLIASCVGNAVSTNISSFHRLTPSDTARTIAVAPWKDQQKESLEHRAYAAKLEDQLRAKGFKVVPLETKPHLIAFLDYGIDDGRTVVSTYSIPTYGQTGYSSSYTTGTVNTYGGMGTYQGATTYTPQYGITGYQSGVSTAVVFTRYVNIDIVEVASTPDQARRVYEGRFKSSGTCSSLAAVYDYILAAVFKEFPGPGTRTGTVAVPWDGNC